jgi:hypothetical protein
MARLAIVWATSPAPIVPNDIASFVLMRDPLLVCEQAISLLEYRPDGRPGAFGCGELSRELFPVPVHRLVVLW